MFFFNVTKGVQGIYSFKRVLFKPVIDSLRADFKCFTNGVYQDAIDDQKEYDKSSLEAKILLLISVLF